MIHNEVLLLKSLTDSLLKSMDNVVELVNYIKLHSINYTLFTSQSDITDSNFTFLELHLEVQCRLNGNVHFRLISLEIKIICFSKNQDSNFLIMIIRKCLEVSFLNDPFEKLNFLNLCLKGAKENITIRSKLVFPRQVRTAYYEIKKNTQSSWVLRLLKNKFKILQM